MVKDNSPVYASSRPPLFVVTKIVTIQRGPRNPGRGIKKLQPLHKIAAFDTYLHLLSHLLIAVFQQPAESIPIEMEQGDSVSGGFYFLPVQNIFPPLSKQHDINWLL